jgi:hypothetical protein
VIASPSGLGTLCLGPAFDVHAGAHGQRLDAVARVPHRLAGAGVEDGPAAGAAFPVALVGGGDVVVADPADRVGFARGVGDRAGLIDGAVLGGVDAVHGNGSGAEDLLHGAAAAVDDRDAVVLLQGDRDLAAGVDTDVLRLEVLGGVQAGGAGGVDVEVHPARRPARGGAGEVDQLQEAGRGLGQVPLFGAGRGELLVALVLHRDGGEAAVLGDRDRVGLAVEGDAVHAGAVGHPDHVDAPGRLGEIGAGGVDDDQDELPDRCHRGGLIVGMAELGQ